ncbi:FHA domain-containing protein [Pseudomonas farsensis]|uniref:FHA domain-containing protein n=1 Tax=Pseudomonas farsensis TaxID=2745492 RepID=A0ABU8QMR7_9PSED
MNTLTLSICNLQQLQHGVIARHRFGRRGGTIGSDGAHWLLNDSAGLVAPVHCEIRWLEGRFCIIDRCSRTYLNEEPVCVGERSPRSLREGDVLRIGPYRVQVRFPSEHAHSGALKDCFTAWPPVLDALLADRFVSDEPAAPSRPLPALDICHVFAQRIETDPLAALETGPQQTQAAGGAR